MRSDAARELEQDLLGAGLEARETGKLAATDRWTGADVRDKYALMDDVLAAGVQVTHGRVSEALRDARDSSLTPMSLLTSGDAAQNWTTVYTDGVHGLEDVESYKTETGTVAVADDLETEIFERAVMWLKIHERLENSRDVALTGDGWLIDDERAAPVDMMDMNRRLVGAVWDYSRTLGVGGEAEAYVMDKSDALLGSDVRRATYEQEQDGIDLITDDDDTVQVKSVGTGWKSGDRDDILDDVDMLIVVQRKTGEVARFED